MSKVIIKTEVPRLKDFGLEDKLKDAMDKRMKGWKALEKANEIISQANQDLEILFKVLGIEDSIETKSHGKFAYVKPGISKSFDKDKCKCSLAEKGVDIKIITESFTAATSENPKKGYMYWGKPKDKKTEEK